MADHSRRDWIITITQAAITQAAVGTGIAGSIQAETTHSPTLPAGVYEPSQDHLGHALMSADRFRSIPSDCPTDYVRLPQESFRPLFFSVKDFLVLRQLISLLLGEIGGEGSVSQEIAEWMDLRISSVEGERDALAGIDPIYRTLAVAYARSGRADHIEKANPAKLCREGLAWMTHAADAQHGKAFLALETGQQIALLDSIGDGTGEKRTENAGTHFFDYLKAETIRGFYTSRAGLAELDFKGNAFYARSPGCR